MKRFLTGFIAAAVWLSVAGTGAAQQPSLTYLPAAAIVPVMPQTAVTAVAAEQKDVLVFGQKIHYLEAGTGPAVIFLHGLGGNYTHWSGNIAALSANHHVYALDQIGFGKSDKPLIGYRVGTYVDFLDKFCSVLNIDHAVVVGNSLGGWIAAGLALKYPTRVDKLVLVDAAGFSVPKTTGPRDLQALNPVTRDQIRFIMPLIFYNKILFTNDTAVDLALAGRINAGDGYTISQLIDSTMAGEDVVDGKLGAIKQPTLIIWGKDDGLLPLADFGERYHREIAGSQLIVFEKCGHAPNIEQAAKFNEALVTFASGK